MIKNIISLHLIHHYVLLARHHAKNVNLNFNAYPVLLDIIIWSKIHLVLNYVPKKCMVTVLNLFHHQFQIKHLKVFAYNAPNYAYNAHHIVYVYHAIIRQI